MSAERPGPEQMQALLRDYVRVLHEAYVAACAGWAPGERAALPLLAADSTGARMTVVVAATRHLHVLATTAALPPPRGPEVAEPDEAAGLRWTVRFYDAVVLPQLGLLDAGATPDPAAVRGALGLPDVLYHLAVGAGGGLSAHHAQHAGTGLANQHAAVLRDGEALRHAYAGRVDVVDELVSAERLGLHHSLRLLATSLAPTDPGVARAVTVGDDAAVRRALLAAARTPSPSRA